MFWLFTRSSSGGNKTDKKLREDKIIEMAESVRNMK